MQLKSSESTTRFRTIFRSLKYRNYRLFFAGQGISLIGTWMQRIAMPWLVYHLTGSALMLGIVSFAGQVPTFILAPFAGVLTDRWNRYHVLIAAQTLAMLQALAFTVLFYAGKLEMWHIMTLSVVWGIFNSFDVPSRQSFVIDLVEKKEDLGNAIALNSLMFNGARLIGPSVAGILLAFKGEGICFLLNTISYVFVIGSLLMMRVPKPAPRVSKTRMGEELKEGFRYAFGFPPIRHVILLLALVSLMSMPYSVLMPVFSKEVLHGDSTTFGFLTAAAGLGALASGLWLAARKSVLRLGRIIPAAAAIFGLGAAVLSLSRNIPLSMCLMVVAGAGIMMHTAASNTILQTIVDEDKRGRVMSFYTMAIMGTAPFGSLLAGALAKSIGTPMTILAGAMFCLAGAILFYLKLPELKNLVRPVYVRMGIIPEVASAIQSASDQPASGSGA
ncbi:MAG: MFS transporter [Bacteroidales bacterium]